MARCPSARQRLPEARVVAGYLALRAIPSRVVGRDLDELRLDAARELQRRIDRPVIGVGLFELGRSHPEQASGCESAQAFDGDLPVLTAALELSFAVGHALFTARALLGVL